MFTQRAPVVAVPLKALVFTRALSFLMFTAVQVEASAFHVPTATPTDIVDNGDRDVTRTSTVPASFTVNGCEAEL